MKDRMAAYRSQITSIVVSSIIDTFNGMLQQHIIAMPHNSPSTIGPDMAVHACVSLAEKNFQAEFYFSFDRALLLLTANAFYEKDRGNQPAVQEDIACAVANIVGGKVKTFLNHHGYEFEMGIPFVAKPGSAGRDDALHVHFSYDKSGSNGLVVNYVTEEHKTLSGKT
jgi:hypothetical protein